jgi:hypothetical protein
MAHWRDTMVDRPETDGAVYVTGWRSVDWPFSGPSLRFGFLGFSPERLPTERSSRVDIAPSARSHRAEGAVSLLLQS